MYTTNAIESVNSSFRKVKMCIRDRTLAVDVVSGATHTSEAILAAAEDCVAQAGGCLLYTSTVGNSGNRCVRGGVACKQQG